MSKAPAWPKGPVIEFDGQVARLSVVFSWHLQEAYQRAAWLTAQGWHVKAGGPAVVLQPESLADVAEVGGSWPDAIRRHNPRATFTSRGCPRRCSFCAVPVIEGELRELAEWPVRPVVCDNNLLATSRRHFDRVVDRLKPLKEIDFNQGLDARFLTKYHAGRLAELDARIRLAFDGLAGEAALLRAFELLRAEGIHKKRLSVYVLFGYRDTPADALYRVRLIQGLGVNPFPMRYQPLDTLRRGEYVAPAWSLAELSKFSRYWSRLRYFGGVPYELWDPSRKTAKGAA